MRFVLIGTAVLALAACHKPAQEQQQSSGKSVAVETAGPVKGVDRSHRGSPAPAKPFNDPDGHPAHLADFAGKPLLVNLWASWCAPCVKELPTLDSLARSNQGIRVLAVSQDSGPHASVVAFLQAHRIGTLDAYQDPSMGLSGALGADVLPTSVLFDPQGREVWRYVGDLDWSSPQAAKLLSEAAAGAPAQ
jgi:thiol-disulfide isomerase/thioredoxin